MDANYFRPWEYAAKKEGMAFPPAPQLPPLDPVSPPTIQERAGTPSGVATYWDHPALQKSTGTVPPSGDSEVERNTVEPAPVINRGTKRERVNVPVPPWQRKLNPNRPRSSDSLPIKRQRPAPSESSENVSAILAVEGEGASPQLVHTVRMNARACHGYKIRPGTIRKVVVDFELNGRRFVPGESDFLIPELTTGMILKHLICQGIRKEEDADGRPIWFLYILSAPTATSRKIHKGVTVARITCQKVDTDWPALPPPGRRGS